MTPHLAHICRHPFKPHGREALATVELTTGQSDTDTPAVPNDGYGHQNFADHARAEGGMISLNDALVLL